VVLVLGIMARDRTIWLQGELDELEREEFFRLKKVQNKKQQKASQPQKVFLTCIPWAIQSISIAGKWILHACVGAGKKSKYRCL
jgi:hypothetical protein